MSSKIPKLTQPLTSARKNEILNQLYINAFEFFKKNSARKDKKYQEIKEACILLKDPQNFSSQSQIKKYSLLFAQPLENINIKILEKILLVIEEIIMNNLVDSNILYEMIEIILQYLSKFSSLNDDYINIKILNLCYLIYSCDSISQIHTNNMKKIVTLALHIFISSDNIQCQASAHATLSNIIDYMMKKLNGLYLEIKSLTSNRNEEDTLNVYCENYVNYLVDIIDINDNDNDTNLVSLYLNDIKEDSEISHKAFTTELQKKARKKETEYGYCFNCRNIATKYSEHYRYPLCDKKSCEASIMNMERIIEKEAKMHFSIYRADFITTLHSLTKLSTREAKEEIVILRNKEFCLSIIGEMLNKGAIYFHSDKGVISIIREKLIDSLVTNTLSNEINNKIFKISFNAFLIIIRKFRENLKEQIEIFINKVMISFLESENLGFNYKEVILDGLIQLASDCSFFVELYVNFDCDINYKAIFSEMMNLVTKIVNGMYKRSKYSNTFKQMQESKLRVKCLDFIMKFLKNLSELVEKNDIKGSITNEETNTFNNDDSSLSEEGNTGTSVMNSEGVSTITTMWNIVNGEIKDKINQNLKMKAMLSKAIDKFNIFGANNAFNFLRSQKMINDEETFNSTKDEFIKEESHQVPEINIMQSPFISNINPLVYFLSSLDHDTLLKITYEDFTAFEMARFIRSNINELNKNTAGEYLCGSKKFNIKVLHYFIYSFTFKGMHILEALRSLFNELYLIGEGQIVDRVVQVFGERYHKENPNLLKNPDLSYYIAFSIIILNTDLHREEVSNKMTLAQYKNQLFQLCPNEKVDEQYLADLYKRVLSNPLVMPGQKINSNKTKKELIKIEKDNIMRTTVARLQSITNTSHNYITEISNEDIKRLMDTTWSNFLSIFSQLISFETDIDVNIVECVRQLLLVAKICGMLHLDTITEAFINTVVNIANIIDGKAIDENSLECIREMMIFLMNNGKYIRTCWFSLLSSISKVDYYQTTPLEEFIAQIKKKKGIDVNIELSNREMISKSINDTFCVSIFAKTESFDEEAIMNFVDSLCRVSIEELTSYTPPRVFSLHKLGEVADFNLIRIQIEWVKIWKLISNHLIYVITNSTLETIWSEALESLRQIVSKLLQKEDLSIYNFQNDFFKPFDIIFQQTKEIPKRSEMVMLYIYHIIGSYAKNIRAGWNVIFNILKNGIERNDTKMNEDIKCIVDKIYENFSNENKIEGDNIKGFIECLCRFSDIEKYKVYCKEIISKVISIMLNKDTDKKKKSDVINMILYGFNYKYFDMMFEVIKINKEMMLSNNDINDIYYGYFKPMIVMMIINNHIDRNAYYDISEEDKFDFVYNDDVDASTNVINALSIKNIESEYVRIINDKLNAMPTIDTETYKKTLILLISQFKDIFINKDNISLFNDMVITLHSLSYYDKNCDVIYDVLLSINAISMISLTEKISIINDRYLSIISKSKIKTQEDINEYNVDTFLIFNSSLIRFIFSFIDNTLDKMTDNEISTVYHKCSSIIKRHLHYLISDTSSSNLSLCMNIVLNLQKIKAKILSVKASLISSSNPLSSITLLQKLYQRVQAEKNSLTIIIPSIVTEINEILIHYIKKLNSSELETLFDIDIDFSDVDNESLRKASKDLLKMYIENELCRFTSVNKQ